MSDRDPISANLLDVELDRRRFLALLGAVVSASALAACAGPVPSLSPTATTPLPPSPSGAPSPSGTPSPQPSLGATGPFDTLRRLQAIIRQSPDHLGALAAVAVAGGDPAAIVRFVQERIAVLPPTSSTADPVTDVRWGQRAALRAGAGTLRERADLLLALLRQAGMTGRIVSIPRPSSASTAGSVAPVFAPDRTAIAALWDGIDQAHLPVGAAADDAGTRADAITARLLAALPAELRTARVASVQPITTVPAVEFQHGGSTAWAVGLGGEPILATAPDGLLGASDAVVPRVSVAVSVALNPPAGATVDPTVLHEVLRGEWTADQVAGRQVLLGFAAPGTPAEALRRDPTTSAIRQPVLRLLAAEPLGDARPVAAGTYLSTAGGLLSTSEVNPALVIGPLGPLSAPATAGVAGASVSALEGSVVAASFQDIELRIQARRADGGSVEGLAAGDFLVTEGGSAQPVTVIANMTPDHDPRVLVVYDTSGSVTDYWGTEARRAAFEATLVQTLVTAAAANPFLVQVIGVGDSAHDDQWVTPDPATLTAAFKAVASNSDVWLTLGRSVPASGAAAVLLVSDNEAHDLPADIPGFRRALRASGARVACLPVGTVDEATTKLILADTGGPRLDAHAPDLASKLGVFVGSSVRAAAGTNYRLRYLAPAAGPASRDITVSIAGSPAPVLPLSYTVPAAADRAAPSGIAGVYLTISVGDQQTTRRLGGVRVSDRGVPDDTANAEAIAEAMTALNALHTISFEPSSVTTAHLLDDVIGAALTAQPVEEAWDAGPDAIVAAGAGWRRYPATLAWLMDPVPAGSGAAAAPDGLRVTVLSDEIGPGGITQRSDVVPGLNRAVGTGTDASAAFGAAMRATIGASIREADIFDLSAAKQLGSARLVVLPALTTVDAVTAWSPAQQARLAPMVNEYSGFHRLVPASGDIAAMWVIDPDTGSTTAVGADGRGSGTLLPDCLTPADTNQATAFISVSLALISAACLAVGGDPSYGCVGADVFGAVSAGLAAFTAPPDVPGSAFGAFSYGAGLAAGGVGSAAGRTIIAVLLLIAGLLVGGRC